MRLERVAQASAFSLIEVTLALGVSAFCLVTVFALLPVGLNIQSAAVGETGAAQIASAIEGDFRATPAGATSSPQLGIQFGTTTTLYFSTAGQSSPAATADSRYRATITFPQNSAGSGAATFATVGITWPARAAPENATGRRLSFVALDRD